MVSMMLECITGTELARAAFMHHDYWCNIASSLPSITVLKMHGSDDASKNALLGLHSCTLTTKALKGLTLSFLPVA